MLPLQRPYEIAPMPLVPPPRSPFIPILRPGASASVEAIVLSAQPYPCGLHYFPAGRLGEKPVTLPHTMPTCSCYGCQSKVSIRYAAYLMGFVLPVSRQHLVELTRNAAEELSRNFALVRPSWRGLTIRLTRQGRSKSGPVKGYFVRDRLPEDQLPLPFDVEAALRRLWGEVPQLPCE